MVALYSHRCVQLCRATREMQWPTRYDALLLSGKSYLWSHLSTEWVFSLFNPYSRGWLGVSSFMYLFICWSTWVEVFLLCCHSIAPCTSIGAISASAICHLRRLIVIDWYVGRPLWDSYCHFGSLSYSSHFILLCHVHSQWLGGSWLWACAYSPIVFIFISVDVNVLVAEDYQLYLNSCR